MKLQLNSAILSNLNDHIIDYPTPVSLSYFWGGGALVGICLGIHIITFLVIGDLQGFICNCLIGYLHLSSASTFVISFYIYINRDFFYLSPNSELLLIFMSYFAIPFILLVTLDPGKVSILVLIFIFFILIYSIELSSIEKFRVCLYFLSTVILCYDNDVAYCMSKGKLLKHELFIEPVLRGTRAETIFNSMYSGNLYLIKKYRFDRLEPLQHFDNIQNSILENKWYIPVKDDSHSGDGIIGHDENFDKFNLLQYKFRTSFEPYSDESITDLLKKYNKNTEFEFGFEHSETCLAQEQIIGSKIYSHKVLPPKDYSSYFKQSNTSYEGYVNDILKEYKKKNPMSFIEDWNEELRGSGKI